jgi:membrane protease YdiL (CAAX protease family)
MVNQGREDRPSTLIPVAIAIEFSLAGLALLLGWLFGVDPLRGLEWREMGSLRRDLGWGICGVIPLWLSLLWIRQSRLSVWRGLRELLDDQLRPYFAGATILELAWISLAAGFGEELLFRGFLQQALAARLDPTAAGGWLPLILSSVLFGVAHWISWTYLCLAIAVGLYLGLLLIGSDSLWVPMTTHAVYDFVALLYLRHDWKKKRAT